jgi:hypothetical protein
LRHCIAGQTVQVKGAGGAAFRRDDALAGREMTPARPRSLTRPQINSNGGGYLISPVTPPKAPGTSPRAMNAGPENGDFSRSAILAENPNREYNSGWPRTTTIRCPRPLRIRSPSLTGIEPIPRRWWEATTAIGASERASTVPEVVSIGRSLNRTWPTTWPCAVFRHPGYASACLFFVRIALPLGSPLALISAVLPCLLQVVRAVLEGRTLRTELIGYEEYAQRVRFGLLPRVW